MNLSFVYPPETNTIMSFYNQLIYLIAWVLQLPMERIVPTTDLKSDLNLDDYDIQMLIFRLEHFYKVEFAEDEIDQIVMVRDIVERLSEKESDTGRLRSPHHSYLNP